MTLKRTQETEVNHYLKKSPFCFYLLTGDFPFAPFDLKTHITVKKVSWGAFQGAKVTVNSDCKVAGHMAASVLNETRYVIRQGLSDNNIYLCSILRKQGF